MKTKEEKLEICSTCTKRKFNPEKGLICSLTNEEPIFDDECPAFEADSDQLQKPKDNNTPQSISGWLTFFYGSASDSESLYRPKQPLMKLSLRVSTGTSLLHMQPI